MVDSETVVTARKWGNSLGIALPAGIVAKEKIMPNDRIVVKVKKVASLMELFGTLKIRKSTQKIKDELRAGWE